MLRRNEINYFFQTNVLINEKIVRGSLLICMEYADLKDEPTGSLDPIMSEEVFKIILSLKDEFNKQLLLLLTI